MPIPTVVAGEVRPGVRLSEHHVHLVRRVIDTELPEGVEPGAQCSHGIEFGGVTVPAARVALVVEEVAELAGGAQRVDVVAAGVDQRGSGHQRDIGVMSK